MSLFALKEVLENARTAGYAVGAFEVWDTASISAVIEAAEEQTKPVILQLGPFELDYGGLEDIAAVALYYARKATVPVVLHLDHGDTFQRAMQCIHNGFTSVMLDLSPLPFEDNVRQTHELVRIAHTCGVSVEGELGRIGGEEAGINVYEDDALLTDPQQAREYVARTGIDALAVAIGTVHGFYTATPNIRLGLLEKIAHQISIPLVLHGGSGTPEGIIRKSITLGIAKINICTDFVAAFSNTFVEERKQDDFRFSVPGVFCKPKLAAKAVVAQKLRLFSMGR